MPGEAVATAAGVDWPTLNARSKFWSDDQRASWKNWEEVDHVLAPPGEREGVAEKVTVAGERVNFDGKHYRLVDRTP